MAFFSSAAQILATSATAGSAQNARYEVIVAGADYLNHKLDHISGELDFGAQIIKQDGRAAHGCHDVRSIPRKKTWW